MVLWGTKLSWILLAIALVGDFVVAYALAVFYPGYRHMRQVMSVLGSKNSPISILYNIWLITLGVLICISAFNFYIVYSNESHNYAIAGLTILLMFGIGAGIISGIFNVNEDSKNETISSKIHGISAGIGFLALTFIPLVVSLISFRQENISIGIAAIIFFILCIVFFILFIMSEKETFQNTIIEFSGLWQRLLLGSMYIPLLLLALKHIMSDI